MRNVGFIGLGVVAFFATGCTGGESMPGSGATKSKGNSAWLRWANLTDKPVTVVLEGGSSIGPLAPGAASVFFKGRAREIAVTVVGGSGKESLKINPEGDSMVTYFVRSEGGKSTLLPLTNEIRRADNGKILVRMVNLTKDPITVGADSIAPGAATDPKEFSAGAQSISVSQGSASAEAKVDLKDRDAYTLAIFRDKAGKLIALPMIGAGGFSLQAESRTSSPG